MTETHEIIGVLFGCFGRNIDGDSWFTWWFNHLPGPFISPKRTPMHKIFPKKTTIIAPDRTANSLRQLLVLPMPAALRDVDLLVVGSARSPGTKILCSTHEGFLARGVLNSSRPSFYTSATFIAASHRAGKE